MPNASRGSRILVLGSINTDLVIRGPRLPRQGETVLGGEFYQSGGGKGANQAVAAARLSRDPVTFIAAVGDDALGREAIERLRRENLDCSRIKVVPGVATGVALILVDGRGENLIAVASGANAHLLPGDVDGAPVWKTKAMKPQRSQRSQRIQSRAGQSEISESSVAGSSGNPFDSASVFLASLESPFDTVIRGLERARQCGATTILNPAPADPRVADADVLSLVDILTPNEHEAAALSGIEIVNHDSALAAARRLQAAGCRAVIVTLGAEGCLVVEESHRLIPANQVKAIDATAAGDAFNGALAVALAEGAVLVEAARFANCAAAISVTRPGAHPSLPMRKEVEKSEGLGKLKT